MFFITRVTRWDTTRDCDYRIAPLDRGYRDFVLNSNRVNRVKPITEATSEFVYFDNPKDSKDSHGKIECDSTTENIKGLLDTTSVVKTVTLNVYKDNDPLKTTKSVTIRIEDIAYADRYNRSPETKSWIVYYDLSFSRKKVLVPLSITEIAAITSEWGEEQYLLYGDDYSLWRKGVRDGAFVLDKALTEGGFDGTEDTDWENVKAIE